MTKAKQKGLLKIGDQWNAITIIALSQTNPLKAIAEFVENSIDAGARHIKIIRGKKGGRQYIKVNDDGEGIIADERGRPNFKYVATHICDSIKEKLKKEGIKGIQGEYGIGLLSFWTVGNELSIISSGKDGGTYEMTMRKGSPSYKVRQRRTLFAEKGTELTVIDILPGIRTLSGEKIQWYLASELRDRVRKSNVSIEILDRRTRKRLTVKPRKFSGTLLHRLPGCLTEYGEIYTELYLTEPVPGNKVELHRSGTRVLESVTELDEFPAQIWDSGYFEGIIDAPFLNLTPGTRSGIIKDSRYSAFTGALAGLEKKLADIVDEQKRAEEERASRKVLHSVQKALKEAILSLPTEEYDWFDIKKEIASGMSGKRTSGTAAEDRPQPEEEHAEKKPAQKAFFEYAGALYKVKIFPASAVIKVGDSRNFSASARDRKGRQIESDVDFRWGIAEGSGGIDRTDSEIISYTAPEEPCIVRIKVSAIQRDVNCVAEAIVTVTDTIVKKPKKGTADRRGLPGYTYQKAPGELWRSKYDESKNIIVINNGHRDYVFASKKKALKLRYICRLFSKELIIKNFPGEAADKLLERMVELSMRAEENL